MIRRYRVTVNGQSYEVSVEDADAPDAAAPAPAPEARPTSGGRPVRGAATVAAGGADAGMQVTAPLPGVVLDVRVRPGQAVAAGDVVLILEAMKMENEITSPADGTVAEVRTAKGATVELGQVLVVIA